MKKTRVSLTERKGTGLKQSHTSMQRKPAPTNPRIMRKKTFQLIWSAQEATRSRR